MRLIDADELKTAFPTCDNSKPVLVASVRATINHMPTIKPERKNCETCRYNPLEWDEEPCDSCTGDRWKPERKTEWIPYSERQPEDFGEYLVTKKTIGWNCEEYNSNDIAYFDNEGFHKADMVIAWCELPEPYREEGEG